MTVEPALQLSSLIQRAPQINFTAFDSEWLAIDGESGYCYSLNDVAGRIWELIEAPTALGAVCARLGPQYAVDAATLQSDVTELVEQLREYRLVQVIDQAA